MSPTPSEAVAKVAQVAAGTSSSAKEYKRESNTARFVGAGCAGLAELMVFHPVDTTAKRLMSNVGKIESASHLNKVVFRDAANASVGGRFISLFPGLGYAAAYKILQRIYKYGGQPFARDYLARHHGDFFDQTFGKGNGKAIMHASAGSLIGIGEIVLLPLDVLKIKRQTNPEAFRGRGLFKIIADEGFGLYRGWGWTAARNAPGSFAVRQSTRNYYKRKLTDYSCSVVLPLPKNIFTSSPTTTRPLGARTLSPPLPVLLPPSSSLLPSTSSRPVFRTEISKTPRAVCALCLT